jgi:hypothetical protein
MAQVTIDRENTVWNWGRLMVIKKHDNDMSDADEWITTARVECIISEWEFCLESASVRLKHS